MRINLKYSAFIILLVLSVGFLSSCTDFFEPEQDSYVTKDKSFDDWYEYRSTAIGLYGLQQKLVENLVVLGELRGDLLTITPNADADLVEIYNFEVSQTNKYADPTNFYKLISACNSFISVLKDEHPEVTDKNVAVTNYDRLYGEALCIRAWAYFNAVRIYGKVPVIHESLTSVAEIEEYLNSTSTFIDSVNIVFGQDGFKNDTTYNKEITLQKQFYDIDMVIKVFSRQLENEVKAVGVNHYANNNDNTWEVTVWNTFAWHALLGQMYLTSCDLSKSATHLNAIAFTTSVNYRYQLDRTFSNINWRKIFTDVDSREHVFTIWFNKANQQQNQFQNIFEPFMPHQYMLKPTKSAVHLWETVWRGYNLVLNDTKPELTKLDKLERGIPSDFYRGFGTSYHYVKNGKLLSQSDYFKMLFYKMDNDYQSYTTLMEGVDTIVYKYSIGQSLYDQDANFIVYRAGGIQLYLAEIYTWWAYDQSGFVKTFTTNAINIMNNGSNYSNQTSRQQLGVLGRVGLWGTYGQYDLNLDNTKPFKIPAYSGTYGGIVVGNISYIQDPFTNEVKGYTDMTDNLLAKQLYLEEKILDDRARELAFEGERFYDLIRVAKRRNDPSFLAKKVSDKYPSSMRQTIYNKLLNEKNWYINIFE
ncbi:MAG TPA: RagB/SusD family nutrient uptake outer membrane protein [Prolixibacteraceae bacterium]|nr:RagB/SusD family nutrient uptake outer membrane protein [Prolixibacteraceae bacterium]